MLQFLETRSWLWAIATVATMLVAFVITALISVEVCGDECGVIATIMTWAPIVIMPLIMAMYMAGTFEPWRTRQDVDAWMNNLSLLSVIGCAVSLVAAMVFSRLSKYYESTDLRVMMLIFVWFSVTLACTQLSLSALVYLVRAARGTWSPR
jgi:hypothetical protein